MESSHVHHDKMLWNDAKVSLNNNHVFVNERQMNDIIGVVRVFVKQAGHH